MWKQRLVKEKFGRGSVIAKSKKLYKIGAMCLNSGEDEIRTIDKDIWPEELYKHFSGKWGCHRPQDRADLLKELLETDGSCIEIPRKVVGQALDNIRRKTRVDHYGVSVACILLLSIAKPDCLCNFLQLFMGSTAMMSSIEVRGMAYGKESSTTPVNKVRTILPLPAVMQVVDAILPLLLHDFLLTALPRVP